VLLPEQMVGGNKLCDGVMPRREGG
jgi:hypothetical protein